MNKKNLLLGVVIAPIALPLLLAAFFLLIGLIPLVHVHIPDSRISESVPLFEGPLSENRILSGAAKLFDGLLQGPESIIKHNGDLYTSGAGGSIIRIPKERNSFHVIANLSGSECETQCKADRIECGRVLGLRFDAAGFLYALDAYSGIKKIDTATGVVTTVVDFRGKHHAGRPIIFVDDFVILENGKSGPHVFYITDSSAKYEVELCHLTVMEAEASGRVLKFDAATKELSVIKDGLSFANGIELSDDKSYLLVNELSNRILWKIPIHQGGEAGVSHKLMQNLPGHADNIRRSARTDRETYWLAMFSGRKTPAFYENLRNNHPFVFRIFMRSQQNLEMLFSLIGSLLPKPYCKYFNLPGAFAMRSMKLIEDVRGLAIEVDTNGNILRSVHDPAGRITFLAEVREVIEDGYRVLYLGSFVNQFLGRVVLEPLRKSSPQAAAAVASTLSASSSKTTVSPPLRTKTDAIRTAEVTKKSASQNMKTEL